MQAGEKVYQDFTLESDQRGRAQLAAASGQRDLPAGGRALADRAYQFPVELNATTRAYFEHQAAIGAARGRGRHPRDARESAAEAAAERMLVAQPELERHAAHDLRRDR